VIDVYTWTTGNSRKVPIFLEEAEVPYRLHMVNIRTGDQFKPEFVAICPNSKVPAIVDQDGPGGKPLSLFESGAILIYLADKYGKFIGKDAAERYRTIEWGDVSDGQRRAAVRASQSLPQQSARKDALRDRALCQGIRAALQGPR
jgi:glutathione S-transferase